MLITLLGFITGTLIGLTGTGGGVLLTPLLLLLTPYHAAVVIGTDIVNGAATKLLGVFEHRKLSQVRGRLAEFLILGGVPGTLGGAWAVRVLKAHFASGPLDHLLKQLLALVLVAVALALPFLRYGRGPFAPPNLESARERLRLAGIGAVVGFLVALTSIGSGSLLMVFLLLLFPLPLGELVGTDLLFGLAIMVLAGALHMAMGHFDSGLFVRLVIGSLPGVVLGSRLTRAIPERYFNWLFTVLYFALGARLLVG